MIQHPPVSLLFVPGHRERMVDGAAGRGAGAVVLDLEDSVPPEYKAIARSIVAAQIESWTDKTSQLYVRVNSPASDYLVEDLATLPAGQTYGLIFPKVDRITELEDILDDPKVSSRPIIVNVETPRSILNLQEFADHSAVDGLFLGGEDLTRAMGMNRSVTGNDFEVARFLVVAAARAAGIAAFDTICPEFHDLSIVAMDAKRAANAGFDGKFAIHPAQLPVIERAFTPDDAEIKRLRRLVTAYDSAIAQGLGAVAVDGQMVDPPVAERARAVLTRTDSRIS